MKLWDGILALADDRYPGQRSNANCDGVSATANCRDWVGDCDHRYYGSADSRYAGCTAFAENRNGDPANGSGLHISGVRPQIAQTIVHLGVDLAGVTTKASLADALSVALRRSGFAITKGESLNPGAIGHGTHSHLKMGDFLLVTIQVDMHDQMALTLQDDLTSKITKIGAKGVLIDISALEIVDSFIGRMIANISSMANILDAKTVVVGMQPAVAITLVELGLSLQGVKTALNVDRGMALLRHTLQSMENGDDRGAD